jgi:TolB-like protein/Tfp pilus assembly protein PilF
VSFFEELKRRNVFRVGIAYAVGAWLLLQLTDVLSELLDLPAEVGPVVVTLVLIGLPLVLLAAWVFEVTPEGIKRESEVERDSSIASQTGRKLDRAIIVVLTLAVGYLLVDKLLLKGVTDPGTPDPAAVSEASDPVDESPSVAVLPFANMSNDPDNEYFSDGLTDTLLHMLAQLPDLRVAARTSSFAFKDQNKSVPEIAAELGVANILEGSVQRAGGQVRVTAQLIRADDGFHVWSQNYTRPLEDIFIIQDEIAGDVASALGASLGVGETQAIDGLATNDLDALDFYLLGLEAQAKGTFAALEAAENNFEQALIQDPGFTDARVALIRNHMKKRIIGMVTDEQLQPVARPLIEQVLAEDPDNRTVPLYQMMLDMRFGNQFSTRDEVRESLLAMRDLLELVPTATFMRVQLATGFSAVLEQQDDALAILEQGFRIDPLEPTLYEAQAGILMQNEDLEGAKRAAQRAIELGSGVTAHLIMRRVAMEQDELAESLDWLRRSAELDPQDHELPYMMATELYKLDLPEEAERWYARVQTLAPGSAIARALEIRRALARNEPVQAIELSLRALENEIDDRFGAHSYASRTYAMERLRRGEAREAFQHLGSMAPTAQNWGEMTPNGAVWNLRFQSMYLLTELESEADVRAAWADMSELMDATGWTWREPGNGFVTFDALVRGDLEAAISNEIDHALKQPVALAPNTHKREAAAIYQPLYADPRVIAALAEREREVAAAREAVIAMMASDEWAP